MFDRDNVTMSVQVSDAVVNEVYDVWKEKGFPYYPTDYNWRKGEFAKMMRFDRSTLLKPKNKIRPLNKMIKINFLKNSKAG
mgnify:CR=1 FL=1